MQQFFRHSINAYTFFWARLPVRRHRPLIIGVTGSVGKTTTKEVIGAALMHADVRPLALLGFAGWPLFAPLVCDERRMR